MGTSRQILLALTLVASAIVGLGAAPTADAVAADEMTTKVVAVEPCRLLDTRQDDGVRLMAGSTTRVDVAKRCGVPEEAVAAAVTLTAVQPSARGFLTVTPTDTAETAHEATSALNYSVGEVRSNSQFYVLGSGGLDVFTLASTDMVVDVTAYFVAATSTTDGRFMVQDPVRVLDTRETGGPLTAKSTRTVDLQVPTGATAAMVNVASVGSTGPGYFTLWATGRQPAAAMLTVDAIGDVRAANVLVPVQDGAIQLFALTRSDVVVDVSGWVTGTNSEASSVGLFVPLEPFRALDTRAIGTPIWKGGEIEYNPIPSAGALALNGVAVNNLQRGWLAMRPAGQPDQAQQTSSLNVEDLDGVVANSVVVSNSTRGVSVYSAMSTHFVADVTGYFTGTPVRATQPVPANLEPVYVPRDVVIISDSAMAGVRWNNAYRALRGANFDTRLESCRRLVYPSCGGREGYRPLTALNQIIALPAAAERDVLIIAVGYNDWEIRSSDFTQVVGAARSKGFGTIVWVNFRTGTSYRLPPGSGAAIVKYAVMNTFLDAKVGSGAYPDVQVWDYDLYTRNAQSWFAYDGVHQRVAGSLGAADWISRHLAHMDDQPCPMPYQPGQAIETQCSNPDGLPAVFGLPNVIGLYG
jgi:hypothetical protein